MQLCRYSTRSRMLSDRKRFSRRRNDLRGDGSPTMRFVPMKTEELQSILMFHRTWKLLIRQKEMLINALRVQVHEFGIVRAAQNRIGLGDR